MENKVLDESEKKDTENRKGLLLLKRILSPDEYRAIAGMPAVGSDNSTGALVTQLKAEQGSENDLWWATLQDMGYLMMHDPDDRIKVAIVADEKCAIVCELPSDYSGLFVEDWGNGEQ